MQLSPVLLAIVPAVPTAEATPHEATTAATTVAMTVVLPLPVVNPVPTVDTLPLRIGPLLLPPDILLSIGIIHLLRNEMTFILPGMDLILCLPPGEEVRDTRTVGGNHPRLLVGTIIPAAVIGLIGDSFLCWILIVFSFSVLLRSSYIRIFIRSLKN
jgi:hypothetical protein